MKYIANCSFGKDSLAQIITIKKLGLPLDEVIYCDMLDLYSLWKDSPEYFSMLLEMEKDSRIPFKPNTTLPELAARFESGYIPKRRKKRDGQ